MENNPQDPLPSVAVIMTCYNEGPYIGEAVRSVLDQTCADAIAKIVIADDGSDEATRIVLKDIETWDPRIKVLYGSGGVGLPGQRCKAIAETDSDALAILDGDDIWTKDKLALQLPVLAANKDVGLVYGDYFTFPGLDLDAARRATVLDISNAEDLVITYFLNDPPIIPSTTLIRRSDYEASGGFDPNVRIFEDTDILIRLAAITRFALVDKPMLYKRNRGTSITGGRKDLMAHHAYVALKAAASEPKLLHLVPRRLSERARKLGNQRFLINDTAEAVHLLWFALQMNVCNIRAWMAFIAVRFFPRLAMRLLGRKGAERQAALGVKTNEQ